jgi:oligopeptide/dipeptide ABC transporter ATP-binding protein
MNAIARLESTGPIIEFRDVTKRFGKRVAVEDVSFALPSGRTLGIVGESGSGKSTCVRLAVGLETPSEGSVLWRGAPYPLRRGGLKKIRRQIGIVFQDPYDSLDARIPLGRIIAEPLHTHGIRGRAAVERVKATLEAVGLPNASLDTYPGAYSGGGRQRIAIARGIVLEPDVLLCDEPTASLDVSVQAQIVNLLMALKNERRISTVFVSHDLDLVHRISDETMVMYAGRVVEIGPADRIRDQPQHPYTQMLLSTAPGDHPRRRKLNALQTPVSEAGVDRTGCVFAGRCPIVQDVCRTSRPGLEPTSTGSRAACFFPLGTAVPEPAGSAVSGIEPG